MRKVDLFGLPVTVVSKDDIQATLGGEPSVHMMPRCADMTEEPYPALAARRRRKPCAGCQESCWYDPLSILDPQATFLCMQCTVARVKEETPREQH